MITLDSPIVGYVDAAIDGSFPFNGNRPNDVFAYLSELDRLCKLVGFDYRILAAQSAHETANWTSRWWTERLNPAGIGITGDPRQNAASYTWASGEDAARAHVVHMCAYVFATLSNDMFNHLHLDPRWDAVFDANYHGTVRVLRDLSEKWATDPNYGLKIAARANQIFQEEPMAQPPIYDLMTHYARYGLSQEDAATVRGYRFENRNGQRPTFIVLHIQAGTTRSSLDWWANGYVNGAKVTASSTVMAQHDGSILKVIPEQHGPWTNGDTNRPTPTGQRLDNLPGNPNLHSLTIEAEGKHGADVTPIQVDAIEWQVRDWMARYGIPVENVIRHGDINSVDRPNCPGAYYATIIQRLKTNPGPVTKPLYVEPVGWPSKKGDVGIISVGDAKARLVTCEVQCTKANGTVPRAYASSKAGQSGPKIKQGEKRTAIAVVTVPGASRPSYWLVLSDLQRVGANGFVPKLPPA